MHIFPEYIINTKSYRLWEDGFKQRYYSNKFGVDSTDRDFVSRVVSILYHIHSFMYVTSTLFLLLE